MRSDITFKDRKERLENHLSQRPKPIASQSNESFTDISLLLKQAEEDIDKLHADQAKLEATLQTNSEAQKKLIIYKEQTILQETTTNLWDELSALIGSADGSKLRTFAQGLTLDALIEAANIHLKALRPRYQLQRVSKADMELEVIDRDLGDDIRAVSGLSGGETFLFSLALALGLSDLSSKTTQIESLFIDEGFWHTRSTIS